MTIAMQPPPDHKTLPSEDGTFAASFHEFPQSMLLTNSVWPILSQRHLDKQFIVGEDSGIYWRYTEPHLDGAVAPNWFYIPDVSPTLNGESRQSYVMWYEPIPPLIVIEFASASDGPERDTTPYQGKFWIYERIIRPAYYAIYEVRSPRVDVFQLVAGKYQPLTANRHGHFYMENLDLALGIWHGKFMNMTLPWLRWWDADGQLILLVDERLKQGSCNVSKTRAENLAEQNRRMENKLRALGIDPDEI